MKRATCYAAKDWFLLVVCLDYAQLDCSVLAAVEHLGQPSKQDSRGFLRYVFTIFWPLSKEPGARTLSLPSFVRFIALVIIPDVDQLDIGFAGGSHGTFSCDEIFIYAEYIKPRAGICWRKRVVYFPIVISVLSTLSLSSL